MRIFDENGVEIDSPNLDVGYLKRNMFLIAHHEAVDPVEEIGHYETVAEYPNGGKDVEWVVDVPGVEAKAEWDEYEEILRFVLYTEEELATREEEKRKAEEEAKLQERIRALPDTAVTWDDLAAALADGVNSV